MGGKGQSGAEHRLLIKEKPALKISKSEDATDSTGVHLIYMPSSRGGPGVPWDGERTVHTNESRGRYLSRGLRYQARLGGGHSNKTANSQLAKRPSAGSGSRQPRTGISSRVQCVVPMHLGTHVPAYIYRPDQARYTTHSLPTAVGNLAALGVGSGCSGVGSWRLRACLSPNPREQSQTPTKPQNPKTLTVAGGGRWGD